MRADEGEPDTIMEAFKPGTGPADSYSVIGMDEHRMAPDASLRSRRRPTRPSSRGGGGLY